MPVKESETTAHLGKNQTRGGSASRYHNHQVHRMERFAVLYLKVIQG